MGDGVNPCCDSCSGTCMLWRVYGCVSTGFAKQYERIGRIDLSRRYRKFAVVVSAFIHGCYDLILSVELPTIAFYTYTIAMFVLAFRLLRKMFRYGSSTYRMKKSPAKGRMPGHRFRGPGTYYEKVLSMLIYLSSISC